MNDLSKIIVNCFLFTVSRNKILRRFGPLMRFYGFLYSLTRVIVLRARKDYSVDGRI